MRYNDYDVETQFHLRSVFKYAVLFYAKKITHSGEWAQR